MATKNTKASTGSATKVAESGGTAMVVNIPALTTRKLKLRLRGITPLITHAWSEKAKKEMRDKQMGVARMKKEPKNPEAEFQGARYLDSKGRDCVKGDGIKNAIVSAARMVDDLKMTFLRNALFVEGDLIPIHHDAKKPTMREDMVRVGQGTADLRYRPEYNNWYVDVVISFNANALTVGQVVNLVRMAGFSVGIHEWRPERKGNFGRFDVEDMPEAAE
jgi:hypothetical protein